MVECRQCGELLRGEGERRAVRCPRCREPLFERPGGPELAEPGTLPPDRGFCALHPGNVAQATCKRCGNFFCSVCRTRWRERMLCLSCVDRLVGNEEIQPEQHAAHNRQAVLALVFGLGAWVLVALAILSLFLSSGRVNQANMAVLSLLLLVSSLVPAVLGLGQATAAIRVRGQRMILATVGLFLSGSQVGVFVGAILLAVRHAS